jgi:uroporphyrinogen decarboxylase
MAHIQQLEIYNQQWAANITKIQADDITCIKMNSLERVLTALKKKEPDRVPVCEMFINEKVRQGICAECTYFEFVERVDIDVVTVPSENKMDKIGTNLYRDSWDIVYQDTGELEFIETQFPIASKEDLLRYSPPDPSSDFRLKELEACVDKFKGDKAIVFLIRDSFSRPRKLVGMEKLLMSYITDIDFIMEIIEMSVEYNLKLLEIAIGIGADIIISADDYASNYGPIMSPAHFQKFILPGLTKIVKRTHELGAMYIKHSDGNLWPILDMIIDTGIDGLHPIDPGAGMDISMVKEKYHDQICVIGNVDCVHVLPCGTEEEVDEEVKKLITDLAPGGGFMISSSNSIHSGVKPGNFLMMIEAAKKYGVYPMINYNR